MLIETERGNLYVVGSHLINETIIAIFKLIIEIAAPTNGVRKLGINTLVFRNDKYPIGKDGLTTWSFHPDSGSAVCSLPNCVESAFNTVKVHPHMASTSIKAITWDNIIQGFAHELYHAWSYLTKRDKLEFSASARNKDEQEAEVTAHNVVQLMCQTYNMEPTLPQEVEALMNSLWLKESRETLALQAKGISPKAWFITQNHMREQNLTYYDITSGNSLATYRENRSRCASINPALWNNKVKELIAVKVKTAPVIPVVPEIIVEKVVEYVPPVDVPETQVYEDQSLFYEPGEHIINENLDQNEIMDQSIFDDPNNILVDDGVREQLVEDIEPEEILEHQLPSGQANAYTPKVYAPYKQTEIDNATTSKIMRGVYMKIYTHLVNTCGWKVDGTFSSPVKIFNPIELTDEEKLVVKAYSSVLNGRYQDQATVGSWILGINISKDNKSIGYKLHIALPDGTHSVRHIFTPKPDGLGVDSQEVRTGNKLVWIIDPNKQVKTGESKFSTRIYNGQFQVLNKGKWETR